MCGPTKPSFSRFASVWDGQAQHRVLDRLRAAPHCRGGVDSMRSTFRPKRKDVQPIIKVVTKSAWLNLIAEITIRRRNYIRTYGLSAA